MTSLFKNRLFVAIALLSTFGSLKARADIFTSCGVDLGLAGRTKSWAVLTLGGSFVQDISDDPDYEGQSRVYGDVGVAGASKMKMGGGAGIIGNVYLSQASTLTVNDGAFINGSTFQDNAAEVLLAQAAMDAQNASNFAWNLPVTPGTPTNIQTGSNYTLVLNDTCTVLRLSNFVLTGGIFTIQGTAAQAVIINITGQFLMKGGAQVVLSGGITLDSVLWNVRGEGNVVSSDQGTTLRGIMLATQRIVKMKNYSYHFGEVIANSIQIGSHSVINTQDTNP